MGALAITFFLGLSLSSVLCAPWNPFTDSFDWSSVRNAPSGFGKFGGFGTGSNSGFGSGGFGSGSNNFGGGSGKGNSRRGGSGNTPDSNAGTGNNNRGGSGFGSGGFGGFGTSNFGGFDNSGFTNFADTFASFQNKFGSQFPSSFWSNSNPNTGSGGDDTSATTATQRPSDNVGPASTATTTTTTPTTSTTTTTTTVHVTGSTLGPSQDMFIASRNCTKDGLVVGLSPSASDQCGSVECECFQGVYFCYSTCKPPPAQQTCDVIVAGNDICPQYGNCGPLVNESMGNTNIFRCDPRSPTVHPSICWMYEILFGKLTAPLGFFESVSEGCPLAHHCLCTDGWVQPVQFKREDFVTPANNRVYVRPTPGNKGAFASA